MKFSQFAERLTVRARDLTAQQTEALLEATAHKEQRRVLTEQSARAGIAPTTETVVDRVRGAPIEAATEKSTILIEFGYLREIAQWIIDWLAAKAGKRSGAYADSFRLYVGGVEASLSAIRHDTREFVVLNTRPYARRLEIGKVRTGPRIGQPFAILQERYFVKSIVVHGQARYGNMVRMRHTLLPIEGGYRLKRAQGKRKDRQVGAEMLYPAIRVTAL